jgi:enoyl-CoA hydratase/carnithine racemase
MSDKIVSVIHESPSYWRVIIDNPPINLWDPSLFADLNVLMDNIEGDADLKVVVFESANQDFFVNHHDLGNSDLPDRPGAKPFSTWPTFVTRLANSSVLSIAKVRGRARAQGFEFALASDIRFASRERALFALVEAAGASVPGGGGTEWLVGLVGRSRALEIVLGADDFDADTAELYGFINRSIPDNELDDYVDAFARRISRFEKRALQLAKKMVNARVGVPSEADLWTSNHILSEVNNWPEGAAALTKLQAAGFGKEGEFELNLGHQIGNLPD